jgi:hypothetical protein
MSGALTDEQHDWVTRFCGVDTRSTDSSSGSDASQGSTNQGGTDQSSTDQGGTDQSSTDQGTTDQGSTDQGSTDQSSTDQSGDLGSGSAVSASVSGKLAFLDLDFSDLTNCPKQFAVLAAAFVGVEAVGLDIVLLAVGPGAAEGVASKILGSIISKLGAVAAAAALWPMIPALENVVDASDMALDCVKAHGANNEKLEWLSQNSRALLVKVKAAYEDAKKRISL